MALFDKKKLQGCQEKKNTENKQTIMLVDDEECNLKSLRSFLSEDYHIITASNGQEALDCIQKMEHPDIISLIISDQRMPGLTGVELFKKLNDIIPNTIRIILTGYDKDVNDEAAKEAQIFQIICKPFEHCDLKDKIKQAIMELERWEQKN